MKRGSVKSMLLFVLLSATFFSYGEDVLTNGDFEADGVAANPPAGWNKFGFTDGAVSANQYVTPKSGNFMFGRTDSNATSRGGLWQPVCVEAGSTYTISLWFYTAVYTDAGHTIAGPASDSQVRVGVDYQAGTSPYTVEVEWISKQFSGNPEGWMDSGFGSGRWVNATLTATPAAMWLTLFIEHRTKAAHAWAHQYIDDVKMDGVKVPSPICGTLFTPTPTRTPTPFCKPNGMELIVNGDFEYGPIGEDKVPIYWNTWESLNGYMPVFWLGDYAEPIPSGWNCTHSGSTIVARHIKYGFCDGGLYQMVCGLDPGKTYFLSGWIWTNTANKRESYTRWEVLTAIGYDPTGQEGWGGYFPTVIYTEPVWQANKWVPVTITNVKPNRGVTCISIWTRALCFSGCQPFYAEFDEISLVDTSITPTPVIPTPTIPLDSPLQVPYDWSLYQ